MTTPQIGALDRILELTVLLGDDMSRSLAAEGLTVARTHLLWELQHRGPSTQQVLAGALQVSARNITGLVDGLVATGFVTREPHPTDRRATLVSFTELGSATASAMQSEQLQLADQLFGDMPREQLDGFVGALDATLTRLRRLVAEADAAAQVSGTGAAS